MLIVLVTSIFKVKLPPKVLLCKVLETSEAKQIHSFIFMPYIKSLCSTEIKLSIKEASLSARVLVIILNLKFAMAIGLN